MSAPHQTFFGSKILMLTDMPTSAASSSRLQHRHTKAKRPGSSQFVRLGTGQPSFISKREAEIVASSVESKSRSRRPLKLAGRDFWFDPRTYEFGFEAGGGQYGMSYDDAGRRFVCNNSDHLRTVRFR
jgi:hypothetical protein